MRHTSHHASLMGLAAARAAGLAVLATAILIAAAVAPPAGAMPEDGYYEVEPEPEPAPAPSPPIQAPKPPTPAVYCIQECTDSFAVSADNVTTSSVALSWPGASGYTTYIVERRKTSSGGEFYEVTRLGGTARTYTNGGLTDNTSYDYRITATGNNGSAKSSVARARTLPAPTTLSVSNATTRAVDLRWSGPTGATGYALDRRASSSDSFAEVARFAPDAHGYTDRGLAHSTSYEYRVRALGDPPFEPSNVASASTLPPQVERVTLTSPAPGNFHYSGPGSPFTPADVKILSVRNVSVDNGGRGLRAVKIIHQNSDTRSLAELQYRATTDAFNGQLAQGGFSSWQLDVTTSAALLWTCTGSLCTHTAQIALEVTWA